MEMTTVKTVAVFAIIFGCFAVLYPKIFHPMLLHLMGMAPSRRGADDMSNRLPPHLRGSARQPSGHDMPPHMRGGAHPGMRASAEMKKAAAQQSTTGSGKGMMGVILPMYAVGIVIYLIYTLTKVFGRKERTTSPVAHNNPTASRPYSDVRSGSSRTSPMATADANRLKFQKQKELEKLLMKAENEDINDNEMTELKRRLMETEAQMSRILQAMEVIQQKVGTATADTADLLTNAAEAELNLAADDVTATLPGSADVEDDDSEAASLDGSGDDDENYDDDGVEVIGRDHDDECTEEDGESVAASGGGDRNYSSLADEFNIAAASASETEEVMRDDVDDDDAVPSGGLVNNVRHRVAAKPRIDM